MHIDKHIELQQLEKAHPPQGTFLPQLLDAVGEAVIAMDLDGSITYWNRAAETLYGWTCAEVLGRNIVDVTPAFSTHEEAEKFMETLRAGESWTGAFPVQRADGSVFSAQVTNNPIYDGTGKVVGIVGVSNEITAQGIVRRKSEQRLQALVSATAQVVWTADEDGNAMELSDEWTRLTGQTMADLNDGGWADVLHPDDRDRVRDVWNQHLARKTAYEHEYRIRCADGSYRWVDAREVPVFDQDGIFVEWVGACTDIDERKRAEEAVTRSKMRFERLVQYLDGIVWEATSYLSTGGLAFNFVSERLRDLLGFEPQDWVADASRWAQAIHEEDRSWVPTACMNAVRAEQDHALEYRMTAADGQVLWIRDLVRIVKRKGDKVIMAGLMLDITKQKQAEAALRRAKKEAEELARLKSAFLTNMSHEIRTPLAGILGFAEIIADEAVGDVREYAELIGQSGERLKDTLSSVLDLARLESGSMRLAPEHFDVVQQIQKLLPMFERQTREGLYLRLEPEAPPLFACLDKGAFSRILTNLISNGLKFTRHGGVTIRLGEGPEHIWIEVVDTGIGISEDFLSRLFDEFQQESAGLTRSYEGTGLGLAITKRLVELMDGTIDVESQKGVGTTFTVRLPVNGNR